MGSLGISGTTRLLAVRRREGRDARKGRWTYLGEIETGTVSTVVIVPVHMEDFLSVDREESGKDTFGQTGSLEVSCATATAVASAYKNQYLYISLLSKDVSSYSHRTLHPLYSSCIEQVCSEGMIVTDVNVTPPW